MTPAFLTPTNLITDIFEYAAKSANMVADGPCKRTASYVCSRQAPSLRKKPNPAVRNRQLVIAVYVVAMQNALRHELMMVSASPIV